ncbi:hypothetical protein [Cuspidothrix issatschenkoi]|uniref:Uncharacterized protein n=1 Tax=Cuspidothrix issatschenkoi CHARLIE-1 TaxID=2052836 RepID=A0A2S6CQH3_9CYAN|nr:hypothetical protein [Cuspidothrix issatschenkoi]PPJ61969.1 hypothetical protein CUN59_18110 [Cuspidothrix issatschenkoi CHARLIE-1]
MAKLLGIKPSGSTQEEIEADLLNKQQSLEAELKENLVPKIQNALQAALAKNTNGKSVVTKPGVSVNKTSTEEERKVKAWRGY